MTILVSLQEVKEFYSNQGEDSFTKAWDRRADGVKNLTRKELSETMVRNTLQLRDCTDKDERTVKSLMIYVLSTRQDNITEVEAEENQYNLDTCKNIIDIMGGNKAVVMTGGKFVIDRHNRRVTFIFKGSRKMNRVLITYDKKWDLFNLDFVKFSPSKFTSKSIKEYTGLYCNQLKEVFQSTTGLYLSL